MPIGLLLILFAAVFIIGLIWDTGYDEGWTILGGWIIALLIFIGTNNPDDLTRKVMTDKDIAQSNAEQAGISACSSKGGIATAHTVEHILIKDVRVFTCKDGTVLEFNR